MVMLSLTEAQVVSLVQQLPPAQKRAVLNALAADAQAHRAQRMLYAESRIHELAAARGLDWATMGDDARETFIDDLLHEDR
jgi:hypothetical protein